MRISVALACMTISALLTAQSLGLVPDTQRAVLEGRKSLCEAVAVQCCLAAQRDDVPTIKAIISTLVERNALVLSAAVRRPNGRLVVEVRDHSANWLPMSPDHSTASQVQVPIFQGRLRWATVEIRFLDVAGGWLAWIFSPVTLFVAVIGCLAYHWYLKRVLKHLDPSSVIPDRVRATLDTLAEGVLVLDKDERIVMANKAFAQFTGKSAESLQGFRAPNISWSHPKGEVAAPDFPWLPSIRDGVTSTGVMIGMHSPSEGLRTLSVNTTPILGGDGRRRGALATFDDVTSIEKKNLQLQEMLQTLNESRDEIHRQNDELKQLATRDPLTGCLNRRAFYTQFESWWNAAQNRGQALSCVMVDIDHFKSINDNHGHSTGDHVLQQVASVLKATVSDSGLLCRYGGEEFCILLQHGLDEADVLAEQLRAGVAEHPFDELRVTASLGVTTTGLGATEPRELLDQADKALYASKRTGRNRVTRWDRLPEDVALEVPGLDRHEAVADIEPDVPIPFHAVTALMSALAYRDTLTAEHSRRVADLCVLTARGLLSQRESYVLEVAALLHDIGKLGVPDAILLKPGPLTQEEWKVMSTHDRIGVEIIMAAFSSQELSEIVRTHHAWYSGNPREPGLPKGDDIPVRARILTIADAFDAMVSDRVYRKGRSKEDAFFELRKCASRQFDPDLVERFIQAVSADDQSRHPSLPVSKQTALRIGVQIERLAGALDAQDFPNLSAMAGRLAATAQKEGVPAIAELAADLERSANGDSDLLSVLQLTTELLELCRSTQNSYLTTPDNDLERLPMAGSAV